MQPIVTVFCPFTRTWAVDRWLDNLKAQDYDKALINLCIIVDGDEPSIYYKIKRYAEENNYRSFYARQNDQWHPNEVRIAIRRQRIADVKNQSKDLIIQTDGEYIIGLEDDTVFDNPDTFKMLLAPMLNDDEIGFVEGVQVGRWGVKMVGAWKFDSVKDPHKVRTLLPQSGLEDIDGGGWYGYATPRSLYLNCEYSTSTAEPWGPDVGYTLWLRCRHYRCFINWDLIFAHNDFGKLLYPDDKLTEVVYTKDVTTGKWSMRNDRQAS